MSESKKAFKNCDISDLEKCGVEYMPADVLAKLGLERKEDAASRKQKEILEKVFRMAKVMCTVPEIASILKMSTKDLYEIPGFADTVRLGHDQGRMSLRRAQFKKAIQKQNTDMLIWLGKNYLGQKETIETEISFRPQVTITQEQQGLFEPSALLPEESDPPKLEKPEEEKQDNGLSADTGTTQASETD